MGVAERQVYMRFHHGGKQPEYKKQQIESDIALHNTSVVRYQELKAQLENDVNEFNESVKALQAWQGELEQRKRELGDMLLELRREEQQL